MNKAPRARAATRARDKQAPDWLAMHRMMLLIRHFEEAVRSLATAGAVPGLAHLCAGQEATNVGVIAALEPRDMIASHHRGHGHCLAKGADVTGLLAEILGRETGLCGGRSGSMHVFDLEHGNLGTNGIVGGGIPLAAGAALAARARGSDEAFVCFFGDGALNQGLLHECMNMAAIWKLPVLFMCENNGYGEFTAIDDVTAGPSIIGRGEVFGIPSKMVDGMDVRAVYAAATRALAHARAGKGPSFIVCNTWRFGGHHVGDKQDYKADAETKRWLARDPLLKSAKRLIADGLASPARLKAMETRVSAQVRDAVERARSAPEPAPQRLWEHVHG
ncbi:MAG: thiamine pyrophosphate-dependent dehydrogenase E1 component subunit alpha [Beijerinckiaceae bacterium]|nr:thiamine pyrophosphate-dependent dehydrogenase E1 component subunit alpha [Beijerinckiaceae bacterium]